MEAINTVLPFDYVGLRLCRKVDVQEYDYWLNAFGRSQAQIRRHECPEEGERGDA